VVVVISGEKKDSVQEDVMRGIAGLAGNPQHQSSKIVGGNKRSSWR